MKRISAFALLVVCALFPLLAQAQSDDSPAAYEVEALNQGLGPAPGWVERETPQGAVESFLEAAAREDWAAAAHMLHLADIETAEQAEAGPDYARRFFHVLDRKVIIDWSELSDRPDALDARQSSEAAMAGEPRKSLRLWLLDLGDRVVPVRLNRVRAEGRDPVWVLSRQTVANIPALYDRYGPSRLEQSLPDILLEKAFWRLHWWEVIALPLVIGLVLGVGWFTYWLCSRPKKGTWAAALSRSIRGPAILLLMTLTLSQLTRLFVFSGRIDTVLSPLVAIGFVAAIIWAIVNVTDAILDRLVNFEGDELSQIGAKEERDRRAATKLAAGRRLLVVLGTLVGAGFVLREADVLRSLGFSLVASAGALTLILAYAARNVLSNIMSSIQISMNQSARIGDRVLYKGYLTSVERINFTYVQLRVWTGERLIVPVTEFVSEDFENWTIKEPFMMREVRLKFEHGVDVDRLRRIYERSLDEIGDPSERKDARSVYVTDQDVFGTEVLFVVPCEDPNRAWAFACEMREVLLRQCAELERDGETVFPEATPAQAA
ncbi:MAG: mechanosensitive ion channel family protein [Pseudooceanicola sp.]